MRRIIFCWAAAFAIGLTLLSAYAGGEEDSMALAKKAAFFIKEHGRERGLAEIMSPGGTLRKGKVAVMASDFSGLCLADGAMPELAGQNQYDLSDADARYFIREAIRIAKTRGGGWIEWSRAEPGTKKIVPFNAWIQRVEGLDMFVMAPVPLEKKWYHIMPVW